MQIDPRADQLVAAWYRADAPRLLAYLTHRTDNETAQDVLQDTFALAYRKWEDVPDPATGWLFGAARRLLANQRRGARRRDALLQRLAETRLAGPGYVDDRPSDLIELLSQLSARDREVLTLSAWYDLSTEQAAQALGCSPQTYKVRLHRARRRLADTLAAADRHHASFLSEVLS